MAEYLEKKGMNPLKDLLTEDISKVVALCQSDKDFVRGLVKEQQLLEEVIITRFVHSFNYDDFDDTCDCLTLLNLLMQEKEGFNYLVNKQIVLTNCYQLLKEDLKPFLVKKVLLMLLLLSEKLENLDFLIRKDVIQTLYQEARVYDNTKNRDLLHLSLKLIEKLYGAMQNSSVSGEVSFRMADPHFILHQLEKVEDREIFQTALKILSLRKHLDRKIVQHSLKILDTLVNLDQYDVKLFFDYFTSLLKFPFSTEVVLMVLDFVHKGDLIGKHMHTPTHENLEHTMSMLNLIVEIMIRSNCQKRWQVYQFFLLSILQWEKLPQHHEVMLPCLQAVTLSLTHAIEEMNNNNEQSEEKSAKKMHPPFFPQDLEILVPALEMFQDNPQIIIQVCEIIFITCMAFKEKYGKDDLKVSFHGIYSQKNPDFFLLKLAHKHYLSCNLLTSILRAVRGMCRNSAKVVQQFVMFNSFHKWLPIFQSFPNEVSFCVEAVSVLSLWFHCNQVVVESVDLGVHELVLTYLDKYCAQSDRLVLSAVNIFSLQGSRIKEFGLDIAMIQAALINALSVNISRVDIQMRGMRLFNTLVQLDRSCHFSDETMIKLCDLLYSNLEEHSNNLLIKKSAFLALQLVVESSLTFYQFVIDSKAMDKILKSIELRGEANEVNDPELEHLQRRFFHILKRRCKVEILNEILFYACEKDYVNSVILLKLLGANINYSKKGVSCLKRAVLNRNEELISFILDSGERELMKDIQGCIKHLIQNNSDSENDSLIATLLSRFGTSRANGNVYWEGIGLGNPKPEWFSKTFNPFHSNSTEPMDAMDKPKIRDVVKFLSDTASPEVRHRKLTFAHEIPLTRQLKMPTLEAIPRASMIRKLSAPNPTRKVSEFSQSLPLKIKDLADQYSSSQDSNLKNSGSEISEESDTSDLGYIAESKVYHRGLTFDDLLKITLNRIEVYVDKIASETNTESESSQADVPTSDEMASNISLQMVNSQRQDSLFGWRQNVFLVQYFSLESNGIRNLDYLANSPRLMSSFSSLKGFYLAKNKLSYLPRQLMENLNSLKTLSINDNCFSEFPDEIFLCRQLVELDLSRNFLKKLEYQMSRFSELRVRSFQRHGLKTLHLSNNQIKEFPVWLTEVFPDLQEINLDRNAIKSLPGLQKRCNVETLDLSANNLSEIGHEFLSHFSNITNLKLSKNNLKTLPVETALLLTNLTCLDVSNNLLGTETEPYIPEFILALPWLRDLTISSNGLKGFPKPSLWKSKSLNKIKASNNEISELDFSGDMTPFLELNDLYLDKNQLTSIPDQVCQLKKLETFDISDNVKIKRIPSDLYRCENLRKFYKSGVQLSNMPVYVQRNDTVSILRYLQERAKQSTAYYSVKMLLMGHTTRGKTTLLRNLINEQSQPKLYDDVTLGIEICEWKLRGIDRKTYKQAEFTISCWDFSGKEDFYATHQVFLTKDAFYMVVYNVAAENIQEELNLVSSWLYTIHARAPAAATFIVGTHLDMIGDENEQKSRKSLCVEFFSQHFYTQKHRHQYSFVGVNCGSTTKELRDMIRTKLAESKTDGGEYFMGRKVPRVYQTLEKIIMKYKDNVRKKECPVKSVIDSRTVKNLINEEQLPIKDRDDLHLAMKFLNTSGTILHFSEILTCRTLSDIYFLDPKWLCSLIVRIISSSSLSDDLIHNGLITYDGLCVLYAREAQILKIYGKLMEKFCILVPLPDNRWLIPSRLPEKPADYRSRLSEAGETGVIQRIYSLMFLPQGLMSIYLARIIAELDYLLPEKKPFIDYYSDYIELAVLQLPPIVGTIQVRKGERSEIVMSAQQTEEGRALLGSLIDLFETVLNEWFHGITESIADQDSPFQLFQCFAVCSLCVQQQRSLPDLLPTRFPIHDLAMTLLTSDDSHPLVCYRHKDDPLSIHDLAPDLTFSDIIDKSLHLTLQDLHLENSVASQLGQGGFGAVYKAKLWNEDVAVKVFVPSKGFSKATQSLMSSANLRKELKLMLRLKHPSILATHGFLLKPCKMLVLELAPHGSLTSAMATGLIQGRQLKHRILLQIALGLQVLHEHKIVYMDLKPDNVLIFSLAVDATVNAKIADYGISCHAMSKSPMKTSSIGTIGFRAPEQIKHKYSIQSDIYTFGLVAYYLITNGTHPLGDMRFPRRIEAKILYNSPFPPITDRGAAPWPDMEKLIAQCTMPKEKARPSAGDIVSAMKGYGFRHLRRKFQLSGKGLPDQFQVTCITGIPCEDESDALRIVIGSEAEGGDKNSQLIVVDYLNVQSTLSVIPLPDTQIQSILAISSSFILVGTLDGILYGVDLKKPGEELCVLMKFPVDAILCITPVTVPVLGQWIFLGLASGKVVCLSEKELCLGVDLSSYVIQVADTQSDTAENPICNIKNRGCLLWLSCGSQLHLYEMNPPTITGENSSSSKPNFSSEKLQFSMDRELAPIRQLLLTDKYILVSRLRSSKIEVYAWLAKEFELQLVLNIDLTKLLRDRLQTSGSGPHARRSPAVYIRQLCLINEEIVVISLKDGQVVVANMHNLEDPDNFRIVRRHVSDVKLIHSSEDMVGLCDSEMIPLLFCVGRGFVEACFDPEKRKTSDRVAASCSGQHREHNAPVANMDWILLSWRVTEFK